jgi:lauroyl/myristoyl acyltransferase
MEFASRIGYACLSALARFLPHSISFSLGETLAVLYFLLSKSRRRILKENLAITLGNHRAGHTTAMGLKIMRNFGRNVVETFLIPHLAPRQLESMVTITGRERMDSITASGRGVLLVTAHLGSWELAGAALAQVGYQMTTVAGTQFTPSLSPLLKAIKERLGIVVVSMDAGMLRIVRALDGGGIVALHIDGDQYMGGVQVMFFGKQVTLPRGPAALALRTNAAILPAFAIRTSRGRITILIEEEIPIEGEDELSLTQKLATVVEDYVKRYPGQWCMFRPFWGRLE